MLELGIGSQELLIVPYGIETWKEIRLSYQHLLLIVPYGIETTESYYQHTAALTFNRTLWNWNFAPASIPGISSETFNRTLWNWNIEIIRSNLIVRRLLIVPYGIETYYSECGHNGLILLIVPYGIETKALYCSMLRHYSFNRTLWNWNAKDVTIGGFDMNF